MIVRQTYKAGSVVLGGQAPVAADYLKIPFEISVFVDVVSGDVAYGIEFTTDDLVVSNPADLRWSYADEAPAGQDGTKRFRFDTPVTGIRLNIAGMTGEIRASFIQGIGV